VLNPRTVVAIALGALLAAVLRIRGSVPAPPSPGGWRDLDEKALSPADQAQRSDGTHQNGLT
jgi:hypothetical protein